MFRNSGLVQNSVFRSPRFSGIPDVSDSYFREYHIRWSRNIVHVVYILHTIYIYFTTFAALKVRFCTRDRSGKLFFIDPARIRAGSALRTRFLLVLFHCWSDFDAVGLFWKFSISSWSSYRRQLFDSVRLLPLCSTLFDSVPPVGVEQESNRSRTRVEQSDKSRTESNNWRLQERQEEILNFQKSPTTSKSVQ